MVKFERIPAWKRPPVVGFEGTLHVYKFIFSYLFTIIFHRLYFLGFLYIPKRCDQGTPKNLSCEAAEAPREEAPTLEAVGALSGHQERLSRHEQTCYTQELGN